MQDKEAYKFATVDGHSDGKSGGLHRFRGLRRPLVVAAAVTALLAFVAAWLLISGMVTVVWGKPVQLRATKDVRVCDDVMVQTFNSAMYFTIRDNPKQPSIDKKGLNDLATSIRKQKNYQGDPTCQTILFWTAYENQDYAATKSAYDALKILHDNNKFPDNNLSSSSGFSQYGDLVNALSPQKAGDKKRGGAVGGGG